MSEKKSNGQVPEEGPDGKNLEQSEKKESFAFLEETIKPKKISRQQGMKQLIRIAICGLVLGGFACLGFFALRPLAQHLFPEKTQVVTIHQRKIQQKVTTRQSRMTCRISRRSVMYR